MAARGWKALRGRWLGGLGDQEAILPVWHVKNDTKRLFEGVGRVRDGYKAKQVNAKKKEEEETTINYKNNNIVQ